MSGIALNDTEEPEDMIVPLYEYDFEVAATRGQGANNDATNATVAEGVVLWKNAAGEVVQRDTVTIEQSEFQRYGETFQAPSDATDAQVRLTRTRETKTDHTGANLKVDDVAFGPSDQGTGISLWRFEPIHASRVPRRMLRWYDGDNCGRPVLRYR